MMLHNLVTFQELAILRLQEQFPPNHVLSLSLIQEQYLVFLHAEEAVFPLVGLDNYQ